MLLHYFYTPVDVEGASDREHQNYRNIKTLEAAELVRLAESDYGMWELTDRGLALATHIMNLPLPECRWEIPHQQHTGESS